MNGGSAERRVSFGSTFRHSLSFFLFFFAVINIVKGSGEGYIQNALNFFNTFPGFFATIFLVVNVHMYFYSWIVRTVFQELRGEENGAVYEAIISLLVFKSILLGSFFGYSLRNLVSWLILYSTFSVMRMYSLISMRRCQYSSFSQNEAYSFESGVYWRIVALELSIVLFGLFMALEINYYLGHLPHVRVSLIYEMCILTNMALSPIFFSVMRISGIGMVWGLEIDLFHYQEMIFNYLIFWSTLTFDIYMVYTLGIRFRPYMMVIILNVSSVSFLGFSLMRKHRIFLSTKEFLSSKLAPLTYEEVDSIEDSCVICREELKPENASSTRRLPCGHVFHYNCLRLWLPEHNTCPFFCSEAAMPEPQSSQRETRGEQTFGSSPFLRIVGWFLRLLERVEMFISSTVEALRIIDNTNRAALEVQTTDRPNIEPRNIFENEAELDSDVTDGFNSSLGSGSGVGATDATPGNTSQFPSPDEIIDSFSAPTEFGRTAEERRKQFLDRKRQLKAQARKQFDKVRKMD